jgi:transposase
VQLRACHPGSGAVKSRTAAYNQLKDLIVTAPDGRRQTPCGKSLPRVAAESARLRPNPARLADPTHATKLALRCIAVRIGALDSEIAPWTSNCINSWPASRRAPCHYSESGPTMLRSCSSRQAATLNGCAPRPRSPHCAQRAPIPASSGKTNRHRLNPAGDRDANRAVYMIIVTRLRYCPDTQAYIKRRIAEGLTKPEAIRCVKRYVARQTYHAVRADLAATAP